MVFAVWGGMAHVPLAVNIMQTLALIMAGDVSVGVLRALEAAAPGYSAWA